MNKILLCWIFCTFIFLSCKIRNCNCDVSEVQLRTNDSMVNKFTTFVNNDSLTNYERFFDQFNKSKLFEHNYVSYRLSINPPFWHYTTIYEICNKNGNIVFTYDEYYKDENSNYINNNCKQRVLSKVEFKKFTQAIEENCFWSMEISEERNNEYLDLASYLLEGVGGDNFCTNQNYHVVYRVIPDSLFYNICNEFFALHPLNSNYVEERRN